MNAIVILLAFVAFFVMRPADMRALRERWRQRREERLILRPLQARIARIRRGGSW